MKTIIDGLESFRWGPNGIECDRCGASTALTRADLPDQPLAEARARGWVCEGDPRVDLCPDCAWTPVADAPRKTWVEVRYVDGLAMHARLDMTAVVSGSPWVWVSTGGVIREPKEWRRLPPGHRLSELNPRL